MNAFIEQGAVKEISHIFNEVDSIGKFSPHSPNGIIKIQVFRRFFVKPTIFKDFSLGLKLLG